MTKQQFIEELKNNLGNLPQAEVDDIIRDQEEYIYNAIKAGRTEKDAVAALGDPRAFALNLSIESKIQEAQTATSVKKQIRMTWEVALAVLALAPLNLFLVFGPFFLLSIFTFSAWIVVGVMLMVAILVFFAIIGKVFIIGAGLWASLSILFFSAGSVGVCLLGFLAMVFITRFLLLGTIAYLKWNINFVKGRA